MDQNSAYFSPLTLEQTKKCLFTLVQSKQEFVLWKKGDTHRDTFIPQSIHEDKNLIGTFTHSSPAIPKETKVYFHTSLKNIQYFSQGILHQDQEKWSLEITNPFYKWERRKNFRLLLHPHIESYIYLPANFIPFSADGSQDKDFANNDEVDESFKKFLEMSQKKKSPLHQGPRFPIYDISVSGLAFFIDEKMKQFFVSDQEIHDTIIYIQKENIIIPKIKIIHQRNNSATGKTIVALQFLNLPEEIDQKLAQKINSNLKKKENLEKSFEENF